MQREKTDTTPTIRFAIRDVGVDEEDGDGRLDDAPCDTAGV